MRLVIQPTSAEWGVIWKILGPTMSKTASVVLVSPAMQQELRQQLGGELPLWIPFDDDSPDIFLDIVTDNKCVAYEQIVNGEGGEPEPVEIPF